MCHSAGEGIESLCTWLYSPQGSQRVLCRPRIYLSGVFSLPWNMQGHGVPKPSCLGHLASCCLEMSTHCQAQRHSRSFCHKAITSPKPYPFLPPGTLLPGMFSSCLASADEPQLFWRAYMHTQRRQRQAHRQPEWIPAICNLSTSSLLLTLQTAGINESFMRSLLLLACPRDVTGTQILYPQHPFIFSLNQYFLAHSPSACV